MIIQEYGVGNPIALVGVPGLLGGPGDFRDLIPKLSQVFHFIILDPNAERCDLDLRSVTAEVVEEISFDSSADDVLRVLQQTGHERAYLVGVSLGGKIVFDFAVKYPHRFLGGFITDVGPGSFEASELFQLVDQIVRHTDLGRSWSEVKADFQARIPDRKLRSLVQSQISYPQQKPPGVWKTGMQNFGAMLIRQEIDRQFEDLEAIDATLLAEKKFFHIFHASETSGIATTDLPRIRNLGSVKMIEVPNSNHFLHISHKDFLEQSILRIAGDPSRQAGCQPAEGSPSK